jgi:hypothetical protein
MGVKRSNFLKIGVCLATVALFIVSSCHNFYSFYQSRSSDVLGLVFTILYIISLVFEILIFRKFAVARWLFFVASILFIFAVLVLWASNFTNLFENNPGMYFQSFLLPIVLISITPIYGTSFFCGNLMGGINYIPHFTIFSFIATFMFALTITILIKERKTHEKK